MTGFIKHVRNSANLHQSKEKSSFALSLDQDLVRGSLSHKLKIYSSEVQCGVAGAAPYRELNAKINILIDKQKISSN